MNIRNIAIVPCDAASISAVVPSILGKLISYPSSICRITAASSPDQRDIKLYNTNLLIEKSSIVIQNL